MELKQLVQETKMMLSPIYGEREAMNITQILKEDILNNNSIDLNEKELLDWHTALQRLMNHEPLEYITGIRYFLNLKLKVTPAVLIPRPETEELAALAIKYLKHQGRKKILDIGTGSGCIALAIKSACGHHDIHALDISSDALEIAQFNASQHHLNIVFHKGDILNASFWDQLPFPLDFIISNPPYITTHESHLMSKSTLAYEPRIALFAEGDGLIFYRCIAEFGLKHLNDKGIIFVEINEFFGQETTAIFKEFGYKDVELLLDLSGKDRFLTCFK